MEKLKKHKSFIFIDTAKAEAETYDWARIGKSTVFDIVLNAKTEERNYIEDEMPSDELLSYKPTISQELATIKGDKAFDAIYEDVYNLPVGENAVKKTLVVFPGNAGTDEAPQFKAWLVDSTCILKNLNMVDEKIMFDLNFSGNIERCMVKITNGVPTVVTE